MKKVLAVIMASGFLVTSLLIAPYVFAQTSGQTTVAATGTTPSTATPMSAGQKGEHRERREHHPEIHKALRQLRAAKQDLEKAAHDFGGHRVAAIKAINQAIADLEAALHYDKK